MDSLTQFALGCAVGLAVSPIKTRKVALISGVLATIPDLDILLSYGDELQDMIYHRGFSHAFWVLSLSSLPIAYLLNRYLKIPKLSTWHWYWLCFWVLNTHTWLDSLTIFGTQIFWPSNGDSVMIGSMFIFDIFYILPLLFALISIIRHNSIKQYFGISINTLALIVSSFYLLLMLSLQNYVAHNIQAPNTKTINQFTMPTPSNGVIWRSVYIDDIYSYERFYNLLTQKQSPWVKIAHNKNTFLIKDRQLKQTIAKYAHFSHGFYHLEAQGDKLIIHDIRMGRTNMPIFSFIIGKKKNGTYYGIKPIAKALNYFSFKKMFGD